MFGFDDKEDDERFKNFLLFKMWATDEEVEDIMPGFVVVIVVAFVLFLIFA